MKNHDKQDNKIILFQGHNIRRTWYQNKWYFSVVLKSFNR